MRSLAIAFVALTVSGSAIAQAEAASHLPNRFEIARHTFFDFGPPTDFYELFLVRQGENGTSVLRITLTPAVDACFQPAKFEVATGNVNGDIAELLGKTNLCAIPEQRTATRTEAL